MDISTLSITELKALAYDQIGEINHLQNNLNLINQQIAKLQEVTALPVEQP